MTTFTAAPATTPVRRAGWARTARIGLWATRIALSAQLVGGVLKLSADPAMVAMFTDIGAGQSTNVVALQTGPDVPLVLLVAATVVAVTRVRQENGR